MSKHTKSSQRVLGIAATPRAVHAILVEQGPSGPVVARRFSRQRSVTTPAFDEVTHQPVEQKTSQSIAGADDFTIEFGDGASSSSNLFLSSEFGTIEEDMEGAVAAAPVQSFEFELGDLLDEVADAGYADAVLAFALNAAEAPFADVVLPAKRSGRHDRDALLEALAIQYSGSFDPERAAFLPMSGIDEGETRYLAVFPKATDAVTETLTKLREANDIAPAAALIDGELTVLMGLARAARDAFGFHDRSAREAEQRVQLFEHDGDEAVKDDAGAGTENTLIVRAGAEDTLVAFLSGETVHHAEILRSLTAFDQAETICSRVLLQQDEHGRGDVQHVLVLSDEGEAELAETFSVFFADAQVELLRDYLPEMDDEGGDAATALVSACGAALRLVNGSPYAPSFEDINFLPKKLARRKLRLPISLPMVALSTLIVFTTLFFMTRYSTAENEMSAYRDRLETVAPEEMNEDITVLQARIDSMQHLYATYTRAIEVLDTLLIGSDRWSRLLESTSKEASRVPGFWVERLEHDGAHIKIRGNATSRDQVVVFASRVDGVIESLSFSEIREWPVYSYAMAIPVLDSLPEAAQYLRRSVRLEDEYVPSGDDSHALNQTQGAVR